MAIILLQTIGLFHQKPQQRETSTIFHGMLIQVSHRPVLGKTSCNPHSKMIRRSGLIPRNASWQPKPIDPSRLDEAWKEWVTFEMVKRLVQNLSIEGE